MTILVALLVFACGILSCLAWQAGFYANATVAALTALWLGCGMQWRQRRLLTRTSLSEQPPPSALIAAETDRRRLQSMLDQMPAPIMTLATDGTLRAANRAARRLFATDDRILDAPGLHQALTQARPGDRAVLKLPSRGDPGQRPSPSQDRNYSLSVARSLGTDGVTLLAVLTDIEADIQAAEATALRQLLQVLSHEIMNSLTPITSLAESAQALLATGAPADTAQATDALGIIMRRAGGLDRFVQGYRILARLPAPVLRPTSVAAVLRDAAALFHTSWRDRGVSLVLQLPEPDIIARLDADLVVQALINLLANGAEAALARREHAPEVGLATVPDPSGVVFRVHDTGAGIGAGQEDLIFRPFFTLRPDGTGIGLSLARQIAQSHGGSLVLESPAGSSASFLLRV